MQFNTEVGVEFIYQGMKYKIDAVTTHTVKLKYGNNEDAFVTKEFLTEAAAWGSITLVNHCAKIANETDFSPARPKICKHVNTRKDYFFSSMQYITCKDCGEKLN